MLIIDPVLLVHRPAHRGRRLLVRSAKETYQGRYGVWSLEESDRQEVFLYRSSLSIAALGAAVAAGPAFGLQEDHFLQDSAAIGGAVGLGASLQLIHIYMNPIKRTLQLLWGAGSLGALYLFAMHGDEGLLRFSASEPWTMWLEGPAFAAVTGLAFKEGLCYGGIGSHGIALAAGLANRKNQPPCPRPYFHAGKEDAKLLCVLTPTMCLAHLSGLAPEALERVLVRPIAQAIGVRG